MPKYDRELIARMLETPAVFEDSSRREQARLLREADNLEADARTVVRDVPDGMEELREKIEALQEFKPWAHKHPHSGKGFVTNMRKSKPPEQGEEYGWVNKGTILAMLSAASGEKGVESDTWFADMLGSLGTVTDLKK
jgi:hypothetical protein